MDPDIRSSSPLLFLALLAANAFFVAAEFALIAVRRSRIEQSARDGDRRAARTLSALNRAEELALAAQIGSSGSTLLLGYLIAEVAYGMLSQVGASGLSLPIAGWRIGIAPVAVIVSAIILATVVHAVIAEQVPKILGIQRAEWIATRVTTRPLQFVALLLRPVTWLLTRVIRAVARLFSVTSTGFHPLVHTAEEIRMLVAQSHEEGVVEEDERQMIHGVFEFSDTVAREVMTPRTDMIAVPVTISLAELIEVVTTEGHSRLPVYEGSPDNIIGVLLAKDLLPILWTGGTVREESFDIRRIMREAYFVPDTKPIDDILAEFRQQSVHIAIVLDEFGGTYGLLTMEDLLEEIVGDINDEYDIAEPEFSPTPEGDVLIDGGASISEVNSRFDLSLPEEDFDTIGGYIFGALGRVPIVGDVVEADGTETGVRLQVEEIEERRVTLVRLTRRSTAVHLVPGE
jgi:CBS domain containing-hemolysin-like protein